MQYTKADVFVYQIMDCLVSEYEYKIVNVPGSRRDIWLANEKNRNYPLIRLAPTPTTSSIFEKEYLSKIKKALTTLIQVEKPLLIINTHEESEKFVEGDIVQILASHEGIEDQEFTMSFPSLTSKIHTVEDNQEECARLMRHMESKQLEKVKEANRFRWKDAPKITMGIIIISAVLFALTNFFLSDGVETWIATLVASGGFYKAMIIYGQEYWRLFTSIFFHYDIFTLLFYSISLYQIGQIMEKAFTKIQYITLFLVSALVGNVLVLVFANNNVSFGIGGGLFGILAAFIFYVWENQLYRNPLTRMRVSQIVMITFLALFFTGSNQFAFLGGFISGLFITVLFSKSQKLIPLQKHFYLCGAMCLVFLGYSTFTTTTAFPQHKELDVTIVKEYKRFGLENYAKRVDNYLKEAYEEK